MYSWRRSPCRASNRSSPTGRSASATISRRHEQLKERSDAAHTAYEKALADARNRAQGIANATREQQAAAAEATNKRLEAELHERLAAAEKSIAATRSAAMSNVGAIAGDTASAIVQRLIGKAPDAHEVAAALGELGKR